MSGQNKSRKLLIGGAVMLGIPGLLLASIPFWGYAWQLVKGDSVVFAGWRLPVPRGFYVTEDESAKHLWRLSLGMPLLKGPYGYIALSQRSEPISSAQFDRDLEAAVVIPAQTEGYALIAKREVRVSDTRVRCFEFTRGQGSSRSTLVRCAVENGVLWLWYEGAQEYVPDFYAMLDGMSYVGAHQQTEN